MKDLLGTASAGVIAGAASWAVVGLVSDVNEPFDSEVGFYVGQFALSVIAVLLGYRKKFRDLVVYLLSAYFGMNAYSYIFGGSEHRGWAVLGLITTINLVVYPLVFGLIGKLARAIRYKYKQANPADAGTSRG